MWAWLWACQMTESAGPPPALARQIAVGSGFLCLLEGERLRCKNIEGNSLFDPATVPSGTFTKVTAGTVNACALRTSGELACFGHEIVGMLENAPSGTFVDVAVSEATACALTPEGQAQCWIGYERAGEATPPTDERFKALYAGGLINCGLRASDSTLVCWGYDYFADFPVPTDPFVDMASSSSTTCGILMDGSMKCFGLNEDGEGDVPAGHRYIDVAMSNVNTCGIQTNGEVECWGKTDRDTYHPPPTGAFVQIEARTWGYCGLRPSGEVECWGCVGLEPEWDGGCPEEGCCDGSFD